MVELLIVMGVLAVLLGMTLIAVNPFQQINKAKDVSTKAIAQDYIAATVHYYIAEKALPWRTNTACMNELTTAETLADMPSCISELVKGGQLEASYKNTTELKDIHINACGSSAVLCYNPKSKQENEDAETVYTKFGVNNPGCPGHTGTSPYCYWCKPIMQTADCPGGSMPTPTQGITPTAVPTVVPTATAAPTATPTPIQNPWGQAAVFAGKVAGRNPPSYTPIPQYVEVPYKTVMNLASNNVTVEAWIKPEVPTALGYHYRIVDNTYRLTMEAEPNGTNVSYRYYFDVQSATNGCGQTVVYSDTVNWYPWDPANHPVNKTVTQGEFTTWKHVAGVLQNGNLNLYENGVKLNAYNIGMTVCNDGRSMHIGAGLFGKSLPFYDYFQGKIDEVRISNVARYTTNFTPQKTPFTTDANTVMLYHFDGTTNDASANGLNGSITGGVQYVTSDIPTN